MTNSDRGRGMGRSETPQAGAGIKAGDPVRGDSGGGLVHLARNPPGREAQMIEGVVASIDPSPLVVARRLEEVAGVAGERYEGLRQALRERAARRRRFADRAAASNPALPRPWATDTLDPARADRLAGAYRAPGGNGGLKRAATWRHRWAIFRAVAGLGAVLVGLVVAMGLVAPSVGGLATAAGLVGLVVAAVVAVDAVAWWAALGMGSAPLAVRLARWARDAWSSRPRLRRGLEGRRGRVRADAAVLGVLGLALLFLALVAGLGPLGVLLGFVAALVFLDAGAAAGIVLVLVLPLAGCGALADALIGSEFGERLDAIGDRVTAEREALELRLDGLRAELERDLASVEARVESGELTPAEAAAERARLLAELEAVVAESVAAVGAGAVEEAGQVAREAIEAAEERLGQVVGSAGATAGLLARVAAGDPSAILELLALLGLGGGGVVAVQKRKRGQAQPVAAVAPGAPPAVPVAAPAATVAAPPLAAPGPSPERVADLQRALEARTR